MDILDNRFRALLADKAVPLGSWLMAGTPVTAEAMGCAGFDWLVLDMEHVPIDYQDAYQILQAVGGTPACPVVRLAWNDLVQIKRALDIGAQTLMFPFVENAAEARSAVAATRYPQPGQAIAGTRGFAAMHRASRYGTVPDYATRANGAVFSIIQLETPAALAQLEEIAACTSGWPILPIWPMAADRSPGPTNRASTPSTAAISSSCARAAGVSSWIIEKTAPLANPSALSAPRRKWCTLSLVTAMTMWPSPRTWA